MSESTRPHRLTPRPAEAVPEDLQQLTDQLVRALDGAPLGIIEGQVRSRRPGRYRRLDCDGRVLAYLRPRLRAGRGVRVDMTGLWVRPRASRLDVPGRSGSASLRVHGPGDVEEAAHFIAEAVHHTRHLLEVEALARRSARSRLRFSTPRGPGANEPRCSPHAPPVSVARTRSQRRSSASAPATTS